MRIGKPVDGHLDSIVPRLPRRTGNSRVSEAHQPYTVPPSNVNLCEVGRSVRPSPSRRSCSSHSTLPCWLSQPRTCSEVHPPAVATRSTLTGCPFERSLHVTVTRFGSS